MPFRYNGEMPEERRVEPIIRSDALRIFLSLLDSWPAIRPFTGEIFQVSAILDASCVQSEIRWRVGSRKNAYARTSLHEAMASGALIAFAPPHLENEIEKHIPTIAEEKGASIDRVTEEWLLIKAFIHFYDPLNSGEQFIGGDLKDAPYVYAQEELEADFVFTTDQDFVAMGARVMPPGFDRVLRDYARGSSILLTVKLGSSFAIIGGAKLISALTKLIAGAFRRIPPAAKLLFGVSLGFALLHPTSREQLLSLGKKSWKWLQDDEPAFNSLSSSAIQAFAEATSLTMSAEKAIAASLQARDKLSAKAHALRVCMKAGEPLPIAEIARRIQVAGYMSRSRNFTAYVRRILRRDHRFVSPSKGFWVLRGYAVAA